MRMNLLLNFLLVAGASGFVAASPLEKKAIINKCAEALLLGCFDGKFDTVLSPATACITRTVQLPVQLIPDTKCLENALNSIVGSEDTASVPSACFDCLCSFVNPGLGICSSS